MIVVVQDRRAADLLTAAGAGPSYRLWGWKVRESAAGDYLAEVHVERRVPGLEPESVLLAMPSMFGSGLAVEGVRVVDGDEHFSRPDEAERALADRVADILARDSQ